MSTASIAEDYVKEYFRVHRRINLIPVDHSETGFDFRNKEGTLFVEVKGTKSHKLSKVAFRYFSNGQYNKAKACLRSNKTYEIHIVLGIGADKVEHYQIPAKYFVDNARPEVWWSLPVRKDVNNFKLEYDQRKNSQ
jgi:hypothetical protein